MHFEFKSGKIHVDAEFTDNICYLLDNSGTGKTFLFSLLFNYCSLNGVSIASLDYKSSNSSVNEIVEYCNNKSVVIFDNADLYLNRDILERIKADLILISVKKISGLIRKNSGRYRVLTSENSISVKRW
jgi:ABC-type lipoprotein export system ATPase subunit